MASESADDVPDLGYRDRAVRVEPYGVEHIPESERHGKPISQFRVWFAGNQNLTLMVLGFYPVLYGLSLWHSILAVLIGALLGAVGMGVLSGMGVRMGVPQQVQARGAFGFFGNCIPVALVNVFAAAGWTAVNTIFATWALQTVVPLPFWAAIAITTGIQFVIGVLGYNMIHLVAHWMTWVMFVLTVVMTVIALRSADWTFGSDPSAPYFSSESGGFVTMVGFFLAYLLAWMPFASDYSRYLPTDSSRRAVSFWTAAGNFVSLSWMGILGVLVAKAAGSVDFIPAVQKLTGGLAPIAMLSIVVSIWLANGINVYGGGISLLTIGLPVSRAVGVVILTLGALVMAVWAHDDVYGKFYAFLTLSGYFIAPYVCIIVLDWYLKSRPDRPLDELYDRSRAVEWGLIAWIAGCVASVPFWVWTHYTGAIAAAHPGMGDVSYYVSGAVGSIAYLATYKLKPLVSSRRAVPHTQESRV
jgi:NCS1 nucleoside transporter family